MFAGMIIAAVSSYYFLRGRLNGYPWMLLVGVGMFLSYITAQTVLFERMIALFRIKANAGFLVYLCDSTGYLGSVALLIYKEFFTRKLEWSQVLISFVNIQTLTGCILLFVCFYYLIRKLARAEMGIGAV